MPSRRSIQVVDVGRTLPITQPRTRGRQVIRQINLKATSKVTSLPKTVVTVRSAEPAEFSSRDTIAQDTLDIGLDRGDEVLATGIVQGADFEMPWNGRIVSARLVANAVGSIVIDIWKDTYLNFPPTVADTITASAKPTLSSAQRSEDTTLTGWTRTFAKGDWLRFNIDSVTTITGCNLVLTLERD